MGDLIVVAAAAVALLLVAWTVVEVVRARAWGWLVSVVLLAPVGVIARFVSGRQFYGDGRDPA